MRGLFIDGFNSFWHVVLGMLTFYFPYMSIFYIAYQYNDPKDDNLIIDISEYVIGLIIVILIKKVKIKTI